MSIHIYRNNIITHEGQSTVDDFITEIQAKFDEINEVENLTVYSGYHGDENGDWFIDFDDQEVADTKKLATNFKKASVFFISKKASTLLSDEDIKSACKKGNVFFTWCDSDTKIKSIMGELAA
ncbi:hypothetical protein A1OO_16370 [Enterovibrio norvegicus FF-33]|uniref:hypothetical protein n=1 Tax=Enterovibrio norvegicus TaxID=188144 RepID=UPI0002F0D1AF|nr:hypothetical protein [Enterovibrio norvegicus]OEE67327.1 hypothetical protein A1OO_16370 [Enterovibrio norvegicus FF-33]